MGAAVERSNVPTERNVDTSRAAVKTYVPAYQKETWQDHADRLGMTQSEFIRTMVQAGRRDFSVDADDGSEASSTAGMTETVLDVFDDDEFLGWEEILDRVTDDVESRLEDAIERLQEANRIRYSGKNDGYTLVDG